MANNSGKPQLSQIVKDQLVGNRSAKLDRVVTVVEMKKMLQLDKAVLSPPGSRPTIRDAMKVCPPVIELTSDVVIPEFALSFLKGTVLYLQQNKVQYAPKGASTGDRGLPMQYLIGKYKVVVDPGRDHTDEVKQLIDEVLELFEPESEEVDVSSNPE